MKTTFLAIFLLALVGCRKEEGVWDQLTEEERLALQNRAKNKCLNDTKSHFEAFKKYSNEKFYGPLAYEDGVTFNHSFKNGSSETDSHKITLWRSTETDAYFLVEINGTITEYQFVKIPKATNELMIDRLQARACDEDDDYFSLSTNSKSYVVITKNTKYETTYTLTYAHDLLAYFSRYKESRKKQELDSNMKPTGTPTTLTGTLSKPVTEANIPRYQTYSEYVASGVTTKLCLVNTDSFPYDVICDISGATTFPATEL